MRKMKNGPALKNLKPKRQNEGKKSELYCIKNPPRGEEERKKRHGRKKESFAIHRISIIEKHQVN